jgi:hypothetical protein
MRLATPAQRGINTDLRFMFLFSPKEGLSLYEQRF